DRETLERTHVGRNRTSRDPSKDALAQARVRIRLRLSRLCTPGDLAPIVRRLSCRRPQIGELIQIRAANLYELTYLGTPTGEPTNDWRQITRRTQAREAQTDPNARLSQRVFRWVTAGAIAPDVRALECLSV